MGKQKKTDRTGDITDGSFVIYYYSDREYYEFNNVDAIGIDVDWLWDDIAAEVNVKQLANQLESRCP